MLKDQVILVNENDQPLGKMGKMEAHRKGLLHRAFSVFIFNEKGELMLQQRAIEKYHSGGLWTNTCCSHPRPGEEVEEAAHRRLKEEMGFDCPLSRAFTFTYRAVFDNQLTEHEFDHVFIGQYDGEPKLNPQEAAGWRSLTLKAVKSEMRQNPENFTPWFRICLQQVEGYLKKS